MTVNSISGPNKNPAGEGAASPGRLPELLSFQVSRYNVDERDPESFKKFVSDGVVPDDPDQKSEIASCCLANNCSAEVFHRLLPLDRLCVLGRTNLQTLVQCLRSDQAKELSRLEFIDFDTFGRSDAESIARVLNLPGLEEVVFGHCEGWNPDDGALAVVALALRDSSVKSASFVEAGIGDGELQTLCATLQDNRSLTHLEIYDGMLNDGSALVQLLENKAPQLRSLALGSCPAPVAAPVVASLAQNRCSLEVLTLQELEYDHNLYADVGDMLKTNRSLVELDLMGNGLLKEDLEAIGDGLQPNVVLQTLHLGAEALASAADLDPFVERMGQNVRVNDILIGLPPDGLPSFAQEDVAPRLKALNESVVRNRDAAHKYNDGFRKGAGRVVLNAAVNANLPARAGEVFAREWMKVSNKEDLQRTKDGLALALVNRAAFREAVEQRSRHCVEQITELAAAGKYDGIARLLEQVAHARVPIRDEHMVDLIVSVARGEAKQPGRLLELLHTLHRSRVQFKASEQLQALRDTLGPNEQPLLDALVEGGAGAKRAPEQPAGDEPAVAHART